ncbi:hypothetical protein [Rhodoblastus sp.]|uniref:hypothetical protein n=1 Tax=Rhodoblastus sp. TaxID=1962975 RepID=UPI002614721A|nr:hypothetical protein [Rhodoblastus sp.]
MAISETFSQQGSNDYASAKSPEIHANSLPLSALRQGEGEHFTANKKAGAS